MGFRDMCPRPARSWCEGSSIRVPSPLVTTRHGRAARVGAAATAAAMRGAGVAGEPLRRVDAPTPLLLRSPPLAKVQSHSHHLLRQVLSPYLAVPPRLEELVVIAVLHHSLLNCVVYDPCRPILRLSVGKVELCALWRNPLSYMAKYLPSRFKVPPLRLEIYRDLVTMTTMKQKG